MRATCLMPLLMLAAAGCAAPTAAPGVPPRADRVAPDTPAGVAPKAGFRDTAIDTDPESPRTRDTRQKPVAPVITQ